MPQDYSLEPEQQSPLTSMDGEAFKSDDTEGRYWPEDKGTLALEARRALLVLIKGPYLSAERNGELWQAILNNHEAIASRLADLFLELIVDIPSGIAFVRNATDDEGKIPKAVRNQPMTLTDTIMLLNFRKELLLDSFNRVFVSKQETIEQLSSFRPVTKLDESAFRKRLESSWTRLKNAGILQATDIEDRCEISPVLKLIFGPDEVAAINAEFEVLLAETSSHGGHDYLVEEDNAFDDEDTVEEEIV